MFHIIVEMNLFNTVSCIYCLAAPDNGVQLPKRLNPETWITKTSSDSTGVTLFSFAELKDSNASNTTGKVILKGLIEKMDCSMFYDSDWLFY